MKILAIETSCDETAVAVVEASGGMRRPVFHITANVVASQIAIHKKWGGVVPNLARREHEKNLVPLLGKALKDAGLLQNAKRKTQNAKLQLKIQKLQTVLKREQLLLKQTAKFLATCQKPDIDVIAVTYGPGLEPALWVGVNFARALALAWGKPLVAVNHMEGHLLSPLLRERGKENFQFPISPPAQMSARPCHSGGLRRVGNFQKPISKQRQVNFPAVALLVSGGHTELVLMKNWLEYKMLGATMDDAAGEAFDKVARMLGLGYPGGPAISQLAKKWKLQITNHKSQTNFKTQMPKFPRPMLHSRDLNFSFSGLKTAVLYFLQKQKRPFAKTLIADVAASFQQAVVDVLVAKTLRAVKAHNPKTVLVGGGVAANEELRAQLAGALAVQFPKTTLFLPGKSFTGDNAAMIAAAAYFHAIKKAYADVRTLRAEGNLSF